MPDLKLDLSRVTYSNLLEIIAPIVPGGVIAAGVSILNPTLANKLLDAPHLGYRSKVAAVIFLAYIAGFLLNLLVSYTTYTLGYVIGYFLGDRLVKNQPTPWQNLLWRRVARKFLGSDLAPSTDDPYFPEVYAAGLEQARLVQSPDQRLAQEKALHDFHAPKMVADGEWYWWHNVLGKYFSLSQWWAAPWQYYLSMLHTVSWAVILLMVLNRRHSWLVWVFCLIGLFFGNFGSWFSGGIYSDPHAVDQTALLFRAITSERAISLSKTKTPGSKEPG